MFDFSIPIPIGSDHAGFCLKEKLVKELSEEGFKFKDFGPFSEERADYPDFVHPVASSIDEGTFPMGIIICGSGNGVSMVANKYPEVRAALCWNEEIASLARRHNDANIIALPARFINEDMAINLVRIFFSTGFEGGRHADRIKKIPRTL